MNKVYIVTSGEYSDYCIESVFRSEAKAEQYVNIKNKISKYDKYTIEEYEFSDDKINMAVLGKCLEGHIDTNGVFDVCSDREYRGDVWLDIECRGADEYILLEDEEEKYCFVEEKNYAFNKSYILHMGKFIPKEQWEGEKTINRFKKTLNDKFAEVKSMLAEGMTIDMINEILKESL